MLHLKKIIPTLFVIVSLASCEDVIQVKLDKGAPLVTVDAFISDLRKTQTIRLTYADDYFSQKPSVGISGASVVVKDLTTGSNYNFTDKSNGDYSYDAIGSADTLIRLGHDYELQVTHQGNNYLAQSSAFRSPKVDSIVVDYGGVINSFGDKSDYNLFFIGKDPEGFIPDYFWIKFYRNGEFYFKKGGDIIITKDGANSAGSDGLYFIPPIANINGKFEEFDTCRVEIHSISGGCYDFLNQVINQTTNFGLFATSPENVKTNITTNSSVKAVGWFNTSIVNWKQAVVK